MKFLFKIIIILFLSGCYHGGGTDLSYHESVENIFLYEQPSKIKEEIGFLNLNKIIKYSNQTVMGKLSISTDENDNVVLLSSEGDFDELAIYLNDVAKKELVEGLLFYKNIDVGNIKEPVDQYNRKVIFTEYPFFKTKIELQYTYNEILKHFLLIINMSGYDISTMIGYSVPKDNHLRSVGFVLNREEVENLLHIMNSL